MNPWSASANGGPMRRRAVVYVQAVAVWGIVIASVLQHATQTSWPYVLFVASGLGTAWCGVAHDGYREMAIRVALVVAGLGLAAVGVAYLFSG